MADDRNRMTNDTQDTGPEDSKALNEERIRGVGDEGDEEFEDTDETEEEEDQADGTV
jgi:hypothetical protein